MKRSMIRTVVAALLLAVSPATAPAQDGHRVKLHVNPKWRECSFQLDSSLTQGAWHQFTQEAGLVSYFRPLIDAKPMGAGKYELSLLRWETGIDDEDDAWNDTFVHPDSTHWLMEGSGLTFPGLMLRAGITKRLDAGAYFTRNPGANYGFYGGQAQYNIVHDTKRDWSASARMSFVSLYGPADLDLTVYGLDLVASKEFALRWATVSPYAGVSSYLSRSHEKTAAVALRDENVTGSQAMIGAVARISMARIAVEFGTAKVRSRSVKIGIGL